MQIHELTRRQLNEVDIVGPDGVLSKIGTAAKALVQPGGVKSALKTITPGFGQGALNTKDLATGDFAQRMQAVKNSAAIKQVAANLQKQWNQVSKTLPAATATAPGTTTSALGYSSVKTNAPTGIPSVGGSKSPQPTVATSPELNKSRNELALLKKATASLQGGPALTPQELQKVNAYRTSQGQPPLPTPKNEPIVVGKDKPLDPKNPADAALIAKIQAAQQKTTPVVTQESVQLAEAASLGQLTDWYKQSVIPKSMAAASAKYLANPTIKNALQTILATADNPGEQVKAFQNLVAATSIESQVITAKNPKLAAATSTRGAPAAIKTLSGGASAARAEISNAARISPAQIDEIAKLTGTLGRVQAADSNTIAYLQALGFKTS
jgi:hypothetical protein